ncbi:hypothetical protein INT43_000012 [Umbelopsis isabellina]|uniref:Pre-rRNA processing protein n=1 Tax=Mortierella isabellina TaxID=91625 RepID=A0A8H7PEY2_MORIS|nr:hypothetical protein INT43_000012 [Umbelopsis isabellina]
MSDAASITPARNHAAEPEFDQHDNGSINSNDADEYYEKPPQKKRFYKNKKYWIICSIISVIMIVVVVLLIIFVAFPKIAQLIINNSSITVNKASITFAPPANDGSSSVSKRQDAPFVADGNNTFYMAMEAGLGNTGPFGADIAFTSPITVSYNNVELGVVNVPGTHVSGGHGTLTSNSPFNITNMDAFNQFAIDMLAQETFVWNMAATAKITALSRTADVTLNKNVELKGMQGFPEVKITSFALPGDDPAGGIQVSLGTALTNPSSIGVYLGTINLDIGYQGVYLGPVSASNVNLAPGVNNITLNGRLIPQTSSQNLDVISDMFTRYVAGESSNTTAKGVSAAPDGVHPVSWLSAGFKTVQLNVALASATKLQLIHAVNLGNLDLDFTNQTAYSPISSAPEVTANFSIPFGFSLNITEVTQAITLGTNSTGPIALLSSGYVNSTSDQKAGVMKFALQNAPLNVYPDKHEAFNLFNYNLTGATVYDFNVQGNATVIAATPIGIVKMSNIPLNTTTSLNGLQHLNSTATTINSIDVTGGTAENLIMAINCTMVNPSNVQIAAGDVQLLMTSEGVELGTVTLPNLTLLRGANTVTAQALFNPKGTTQGQNLLTTFVAGKDNNVGIAGYSNSTAIQSLAYAFGNVSLASVLPGLKSQLIQSASLVVLPNTVQTTVAGTSVTIANPFSAGLTITQVKAAVTYAGMPVGNIDADISSNPIVVGGKATTPSPSIPIKMNLAPASVALLLRENAASAGLDLNPIDALLTMGGFDIQGQQHIDATPALFQSFNISDFVIKALANLHVDLQLESLLNIGQYSDTLQIVQTNVPTKTDSSITYLIPVVGQPLVQSIINGAKMTFSSTILSQATDTGFTVQLNGQLTGTGPFDATIGFPAPLTVAWQGRNIGAVTMPSIQTVADKGATFSISAHFAILDQDAMADFSAYMLLQKDFVWDISGTDVSVTAMDYTFTNLSMTKSVTLTGMAGLVNDVKINSFNLPSNDPAGGISLVLETTLTNPSQVGVDLQGLGFESYFGSVDIGPVAGTNVNLPPQGTATVQMKGRLIPQSGSDGLNALQTLFDNYLSSKETALSVKGSSASGPSGQISWLSKAFQQLTIQNVMLPGGPNNLTLIPAVTIKQFTFDFTKGAYSPDSSSNDIEAQFKNPFGFPLSITGLQETIVAAVGGHDMASLAPPFSPATTDTSTGIIKTGFEHVPFKVYEPVEEVFNQFVKGLTLTAGGALELKGNISKSAVSTAAGDFYLSGITYDVQSQLSGFNNFGGQFTINSVDITGATPQYVILKLTITMTNPSFITITVGDISFDTLVMGINIGPTILNNLTIAPGAHQYAAEFHLTPNGANAPVVSAALSGYLQQQTMALNVKGSTNSTPIASLKEGLSGVSLTGSLTGIDAHLITGGVVKNLNLLAFSADTYITIQNPLDVQFSITGIKASIMYQGIASYFQLASIDATLSSPFTVPAKGTATSGAIPLVFTDPIAHLLDLLAILGKSSIVVDISQNATIVVGDGFNNVLTYAQKGVTIQVEILPGTAEALTAKMNGTSSALSSPIISATSGSSSAAASAAASSTTTTSESSETPSSSSSSSDQTTATPEPTPSKSDDSSHAAATTTSSKPWPLNLFG